MRTILLIIIALLSSCKTEKQTQTQTGLIANNAMVVSARQEASDIGLQILKQGGNAFDAMIATELALAVAFPFAGNIGGGGFMVYRDAQGNHGALDFREKAPLAAHRNMYLDQEGNIIPNKSTLGGSAVGVPGTIAGIFEVHQKFGSLPISQIIQPVIDLAKKGVVVTQVDENSLNNAREEIKKVSGPNTLFSKTYKKGDTIKHLNFAQTLEKIKNNGPDEFYKGQTAKTMVNFLQQNGSTITLQDLELYQAIWRKPIVFNYKDLKIISMSPPSSGGIVLAQILKTIEPHNLQNYKHNSTAYVQLLTEAMRRAYADRSHFLGDPDFVTIPTDSLLSTYYLKQRMANYTPNQATPSSNITHGNIIIEKNETTHYSIVDSFGNAVSVTTTLNGAYGSKLYSQELGIFFNNQMDDFSSKPGTPNMFGLIGAEANSIAPQKRMLSSMTPTIIEKNNQLYMVLGTPGGSRIITTVLQTLLNVYEFNMTMQQAADAPRFHHQWLPDKIYIEKNTLTPKTIQQLQNNNYTLSTQEAQIIGSITAILVHQNGTLEAGADNRRDNAASGY